MLKPLQPSAPGMGGRAAAAPRAISSFVCKGQWEQGGNHEISQLIKGSAGCVPVASLEEELRDPWGSLTGKGVLPSALKQK